MDRLRTAETGRLRSQVRTAMYSEDDLLPVSALQHLVFCERQCALIYLEQTWKDNALTLQGSHLHDRTHETAPRRESRGDLLITRGLPIRSLRLGLIGVADVVEFHRVPAGVVPAGALGGRASVAVPGVDGLWKPYPVEYKRGKPKPILCDEVQLCAQAMCIEEMLEVHVPEGALFYGAIQRRHDVRIDTDLRKATEAAAARLRELILGRITPRAEQQPKCKSCSLLDACRPDATGSPRSAISYIDQTLDEVLNEREVEQ